MADLLSRSNPVQSTEWSLHPVFTPHVYLFATHLNHKLPLYVSPVPDQNAWDIDALNITGLFSLLMLTLLRLSLTRSGFPQIFDNWIQGLYKDFQGQQQRFSRIYFKARPPLPPLLAIRSSHKILFCHMILT